MTTSSVDPGSVPGAEALAATIAQSDTIMISASSARVGRASRPVTPANVAEAARDLCTEIYVEAIRTSAAGVVVLRTTIRGSASGAAAPVARAGRVVVAARNPAALTARRTRASVRP